MNSFEKFSEDKLPDRSKFYSFLKDERISKTDDCISNKNGYISEKGYYLLLSRFRMNLK